MIASRIISATALLLVLSVPLIQWRADSRAGRSSLLARLCSEPPTADAFKGFEEGLADRSFILATFRPVSQWLQFHLFGDAGSQVLRGREGWLFYRPGVEAAVLRGPSLNPLEAIRDFRDQLASRGIDLLVVPAPNKESVYPDQLFSTTERSHRWGKLDELFAGLRESKIEYIDLRESFGSARDSGTDKASRLYLKQDTHWSPSGLLLASRTIADVLRSQFPPIVDSPYSTRTISLNSHGDLLKMLRTPQLLEEIEPESISAIQVLYPLGQPIQSDATASILLMGDSFLRIFERDEPGSAGLPAHSCCRTPSTSDGSHL